MKVCTLNECGGMMSSNGWPGRRSSNRTTQFHRQSSQAKPQYEYICIRKGTYLNYAAIMRNNWLDFHLNWIKLWKNEEKKYLIWKLNKIIISLTKQYPSRYSYPIYRRRMSPRLAWSHSFTSSSLTTSFLSPPFPMPIRIFKWQMMRFMIYDMLRLKGKHWFDPSNCQWVSVGRKIRSAADE